MQCDFALTNGTIITMDPLAPRADWVAVKDKRIVAVGTGDENFSDTEIIDLKGHTVLPGLFDNHCHVMTTGFYLAGVDLVGAKSIAEVLTLLETECKKKPNGEWVFGVGFMAYLMAENRFPDRWELDLIAHGHPILISTQTLHGCALNSMAISIVNIPDMQGVMKNEEGVPTGILLADEVVFPTVSKIMGLLPDEQIWDYVKECSEYAASKGVTSMSGLMGQFIDGDKDVHLTLKRNGELPIDITIYYQTWDFEKVKDLDLKQIGGCLTLDGAGFEYTMALQEPYPQRPERRGFLIHSDEEIYQLISKAHRNGIQCSFHALGDRAIDQLVYIYQQVILEQGKKDLRHRIEHFSLPSDKHMDLLAQYGLIASMQPAFSGLWGQPGSGVYVPMLGRERADRMEVFPEIIKRGGIICGGSDSPVTMIDPLFGIACCINNPDPLRNISVTDAIKIFTVNSAFATHQEKDKGTISVGKKANFTVIDKDPYRYASSDEIYNMKALMTIKDGEVTFRLN
jgi:predicted amidohydrolase YtcJ